MWTLILHIAFANYGHRGCQDSTPYFKAFPENSFIALEECLTGPNAIQDSSLFTYLEFDVQESLDGKLIVFHDDTLKRMVDEKKNAEAVKYVEAKIKERKGRVTKFKNIRVGDLMFEELQLFVLKGRGEQRIPELSEYFQAIKSLGLRKPLILEIKNIRSDTAWAHVLDLMQDFYYEYLAHQPVIIERDFDFPGIVTFLSFKKNVKRSLGKIGSERHQYWCEQIQTLGLHGIYRPIFHGKDYCEK